MGQIMEHDLTITEAVLKSLLHHFWYARDNRLPKTLDLYPKGYLISYGHLMDISGVPIDPRNAGGPLFHVASYCEQSGWPPINSLVVRSHERYPGDGYFSAPGSIVSSSDFVERMTVWDRCARQCVDFDGYPRKISISY